MASLFIPKSTQFSTDAGAPLNGGLLNFYIVGTTTRKNTYPTEADALALTNANTNPIVLEADGRPAVDVWIVGRYKFDPTDSDGVTIGQSAVVEDLVTASAAQAQATAFGGNNSGSADALVFAFTPAITSYTNGIPLYGRITADNTGAVTLNAGGGIKSLVKRDGAALVAGDLQGPDLIHFAYDSTSDVMRLLSANWAASAANNAYLNVNQSFTKAQGVDRAALTDAATVAVDASLSNVFTLTLAGNRTLGQPTNPKDGQGLTIFITQDGTGSRTLAYHADWLFPGGVDPTLTTTAAAVDVLSAVYNGATTKWYATLNKAFA